MNSVVTIIKTLMSTDLEFGRMRLEMIFSRLRWRKLRFSEIRGRDEVIDWTEVSSVTPFS